jgi:hypothetical protein
MDKRLPLLIDREKKKIMRGVCAPFAVWRDYYVSFGEGTLV